MSLREPGGDEGLNLGVRDKGTVVPVLASQTDNGVFALTDVLTRAINHRP